MNLKGFLIFMLKMTTNIERAKSFMSSKMNTGMRPPANSAMNTALNTKSDFKTSV